MVKSRASSVEEYLGELPPERRDVVAAVRAMVLAALPAGYREGMNWGMIVYEVPFERYPTTYNKHPLCYLALAAQKNHFALYLNGITPGSPGEARLRAGFESDGKKLDMGKSCLRFKRFEDLPPEPVREAIAALSVDEFTALYERSRS